MAKIRLTCPACESDLQVDDAHEGQEVECGNCGRVFVGRRRAEAEPAPPARPEQRPEPAAPRVPIDLPPPPRREEPKRSPPPSEQSEEPAAADGGAEYEPPAARSARARPPEPPARPARPRPPRPRREEPDREPAERPRPAMQLPAVDFETVYHDDDGGPLDADDDLGPADGERAGDGLATTALVLGLVSVALVLLTLPFAFCCAILPLPWTTPLALAAVVTGGLGLRGDDDRKPLAVVGLVLGALCLVYAALQLAFHFVPEMNAGR